MKPKSSKLAQEFSFTRKEATPPPAPEVIATPVQATPPIEPAPVAPAPSPEPITPAPKSMSKSLIAADVESTGNIESQGDIEVQGTHTGNIAAAGSVLVTGKVNGNIEAKELVLHGCTISADLLSTSGNVTIGLDANVTGDISCESIDISARIEGNIRANKKCTVSSIAVIKGDISAAALSIEEGAKLSGRIEIVSE